MFCGSTSYPATYSSQSFPQSTFAPSLAHIKNAPLSFLLSEYVSGGGGVNRCCSITGMSARTDSVMVWLEKSYGPKWANGEATSAIESRCACSIICCFNQRAAPSSTGKVTYVVLLSSEVADLFTGFPHHLAISTQRRA
jgi:hypothetical protein